MIYLRNLYTALLFFTVITTLDCKDLQGSVNHWTVEKKRQYPSAPGAFTQGFLYHEGNFYISTGLYGRSSLIVIETETGNIIQSISLSPDLFGEGLAKINDNFYQLTWKNGRAIAYKIGSSGLEREFEKDFSYAHQGWGLASDGNHLILSDGSARLRFYSLQDHSMKKTVEVTYLGSSVSKLNEMAYINGKIFANVLGTDKIIVINPEKGDVTDVIHVDIDKLFYPNKNPLSSNKAAFLNGIAFDSKNNRLFITGKLWTHIFEISLVPQSKPTIGSESIL